jgi:hypothetical protein
MAVPLAVTLEVLSGANLAAKDKNGYSDPFCEIRFKKIKFRTKVISQCLNPTWNEKFKLGFFTPEDEIEIFCWDKDRINPNEPMGYASIPLKDYSTATGEYPLTLLLQSRPGCKDEVSGTINVSLHIKDKLKKKQQNRIRATTRFVGGIISRKVGSSMDETASSLSTPAVSSSSSGSISSDIDPSDKARVITKLTSFFKIRPSKDEFEDHLRKHGILKSDNTSTKVFATSLDQVMARQKAKYPDLKIPLFVHGLIQKLMDDPTTFNETGLFRISGAAATTQKIRAQVDAGKEPDLSQISRDDAASLLKEYIRELPEPIFTFHLANEWVAAANLPEKQIVPRLRVLVRQLPKLNRHLWQAVNEFLYKLSLKSDVNLMTPQNIGIVIGPNVLWQPPLCMPLMEMNTVVMNLVTYCTEIWAPGPEDEPSSPTEVTPRTPGSRRNTSNTPQPLSSSSQHVVTHHGLGAAAALAAAFNSSSRRGTTIGVVSGSTGNQATERHPFHHSSTSVVLCRTPDREMYQEKAMHEGNGNIQNPTHVPMPERSPRQTLPTSLPSTWSVGEVADWLTAKGFGQYVEAFKTHQVDGKKLFHLNPDALLTEFDIQSLGHRKKIIFRVHDLMKIEKDAMLKTSGF